MSHINLARQKIEEALAAAHDAEAAENVLAMLRRYLCEAVERYECCAHQRT